jgi:flagellar biosynthetic protein FliQ
LPPRPGAIVTDAAILLVVREGLSLALLLSLPILAVSLGVGLLFGVLQAATQLQEQTLSFVPRLAAVLLAIALLGGWMGSEILRYTAGLWQLIGGIHL